MGRLVIRCKSCGDAFVVHGRCYRGHAYCGTVCQRAGRALTARAARLRFRQTQAGREEHREAERSRRDRRRVADQCSKNLPNLSEIAARSEKSDACANETRSVPHQLASRARRGIHPLARLRLNADGDTVVAANAADAGDVVLERLAGRACIACGARDGRLVFVVGGRPRGHPP